MQRVSASALYETVKTAAGGAEKEPEVATFDAVLEAERGEIRVRRFRAAHPDAELQRDAQKRDELAKEMERLRNAKDEVPRHVTGLALSGGGIRSATFALGLLQKLDELRLLRTFDYLSTVSGGGYTGGWWSAWLSRGCESDARRDVAREKEVFPARERLEPERWPEYLARRSRAMHGRRGGTNEERAKRTAREEAADRKLADEKQAQPDGSLSASSNDPIHHLRLFANYLTPRRGLLSGDTWRAITVIGRNLVLTWAVLVPVLVAAILLGQMFFAAQDDAARSFFYVGSPTATAVPGNARNLTAVAGAQRLASTPAAPSVRTPALTPSERAAALRTRLALMAKPVLVLASWLLVLTLLWLLTSPGRKLASLAGFLGVAAIIWSLSHAFGTVGPAITPREVWASGWMLVALLGAGGLALWKGILLMADARRRNPGSADVRRNELVRLQSACAVALVLLVAILGVAGFGHDLVRYVFASEPGHPVYEYVKKAGGVGAALLALGLGVFTAVKGAPSVSDVKRQQDPNQLSRLVFSVAPVLVVLVLAVGTAAAMHSLVRSAGPSTAPALAIGTWAAITVLLSFAIIETWTDEIGLPRLRRLLIFGLPVTVGALTWSLMPSVGEASRVVVLTAIVVVAIITLGRLTSTTVEGRLVCFGRLRLRYLSGWRGLVAMVAFAIAVTWAVDRLALPPGGTVQLPALVVAAIATCGIFALTELVWLNAERWRAASLVAVAFIGVLSFAVPAIVAGAATRAVGDSTSTAPAAVPYAAITFALAIIAIGGVVGLGWMADPNQLSMHTFYKARLVRAYLGASNSHRENHEITESELHDDVRLADLANCDRGAPYHLVNTTLNLVGGRDLTTAQRSADTFTFTKHYCGSPRTGFRPTADYMRGAVTLGTAVAASGAAVSPSMGSKTPSAALAMLLTLFNARLGYWAPTPNQPRWRSPQARLWPFYTLRECLSQTTALSTYCYLTDGGHFDNTGLHALVARGCQYIVLSDGGADPKPCFEDIGNVIRRCRIDFGTEITLDIDRVSHPPKDRRAKAHVVVGSIRYSRDHARTLKWPGFDKPTFDDVEARTGVIVWIKPTLTQGEPVDVRQYALENAAFPQQTTTDQWYDEAQFESYRALGVHSTVQAFGDVPYPAMSAESSAEMFDALRAWERRNEEDRARPSMVPRDRMVARQKRGREGFPERSIAVPPVPLPGDRHDDLTRRP
jgi:hypothetical protein